MILDESQTISYTNLRKMQNYKEKRQNNGYLRKPKAQTKTRLIYLSIPLSAAACYHGLEV